jgi:hypothetical protein
LAPEFVPRAKEIVSEAGYDLFTAGGAVEVANLPTKVARELEKYIKNRPQAKPKLSQKKQPAIKRQPSFPKPDLAPTSLAPPRIPLNNHISRDSKPTQGHLPIFENSSHFPLRESVAETNHHSDDHSNTSSFYSDSDED